MGSGLLGSTALEIAIGLSFTYLLLALLCTTINEWLAGLFNWRRKLLKEGIRQLLDNQPKGQETFLDLFEAHPLIKGMMRGENYPSYMPARTFAAVVLDLLRQGNPGPNTPSSTEAVLSWIDTALTNDGDVKKALRALVPPTGGDFPTLQKNLEGWFDDVMDRVSGWHKRRTQLWTVIVALAITFVANADTLKILGRLKADSVLRQAVVDAAKARNSQSPPAAAGAGSNSPSTGSPSPNPPTPNTSKGNQDAAKARSSQSPPAMARADSNSPSTGSPSQNPPTSNTSKGNQENSSKPTACKKEEGDPLCANEEKLLSQLIGWKEGEFCKLSETWPQSLPGWLLTIVAISLGAPFWFDMLNKFMNIRSSGKSPDEGPKTPEKKQLPPADKVP